MTTTQQVRRFIHKAVLARVSNGLLHGDPDKNPDSQIVLDTLAEVACDVFALTDTPFAFKVAVNDAYVAAPAWPSATSTGASSRRTWLDAVIDDVLEQIG